MKLPSINWKHTNTQPKKNSDHCQPPQKLESGNIHSTPLFPCVKETVLGHLEIQPFSLHFFVCGGKKGLTESTSWTDVHQETQHSHGACANLMHNKWMSLTVNVIGMSPCLLPAFGFPSLSVVFTSVCFFSTCHSSYTIPIANHLTCNTFLNACTSW